MSRYLNRADIFSCRDRREVEVEAFGGTVRVLEPVGKDRVEVERLIEDETMSGVEKVARIMALACVDELGDPLFDYTSDEHIKQLMGKSMRESWKIRAALLDLCRLRDVSEARDAVGKSEATPGNGSSTD